MSDPAIKLFGKTIQLPEIALTAVDSGGVNPPYSSEARLHDGPSEDRSTSSNSSLEEHNSDRVGDEQEAEKKDPTGEPLIDTKEEDGAQPIMLEESKVRNATSTVNDNTKKLETEAAPVDDPNTEEAQSETSNPQEKTLKKPDKILPCPRCNSMDTKFCYYNNYNVSQPRHFCKNCQRYWTAGGTMRNVPVGAGRRKNKYSASHYRHLAVSEALQNAQVDLPNGIHHPTLKTNGTVLTFGSDAPLCESMASVMKISGKAMMNGSENGFHKPEKTRSPISYGPGNNGDDNSSGSSVTAANAKDEVGKPELQNPVIQNFHGFPPQLPVYPGAPWPYPWNTGQWNSPVPQILPPGFCPPGFPMPFYPAAPYWGCSVPVPGTWNVQWVTPATLSPNHAAPTSGPNSTTLGKHSRDENVPKSTDSFDEDSSKENNPEKSLWVPKTLRIDDPGEAAKSSIWATLGIKNERAHLVTGGGLFKAFHSKGNEKSHIFNPSAVLQANPAAMCRSQNFREST